MQSGTSDDGAIAHLCQSGLVASRAFLSPTIILSGRGLVLKDVAWLGSVSDDGSVRVKRCRYAVEWREHAVGPCACRIAIDGSLCQ